MRTVNYWRQVFADKTPEYMADLILQNLIGYRTTNLHRQEDLDTTLYAILALLQDARKIKKFLKEAKIQQSTEKKVEIK